MSNKTYRLLDLEGEDWLIAPGDPSHPLLDRLDKLSWEPRLPASVLATGQVSESAVNDAVYGLNIFLEQEWMETSLVDPILLDTHRTLRQLRFLKEGP